MKSLALTDASRYQQQAMGYPTDADFAEARSHRALPRCGEFIDPTRYATHYLCCWIQRHTGESFGQVQTRLREQFAGVQIDTHLLLEYDVERLLDGSPLALPEYLAEKAGRGFPAVALMGRLPVF